MTAPMDFAQLSFRALAHATAGEGDQAASLLTTIATNADTHQMYGICCGFAEAGKLMLTRIFGDQAPGPGGMWVLEQIKPGALDDPAEAFAARFLVAYANGDKVMTLDMYQALLESDPDTYTDSVCTLLAEVAGICRTAIKQKRRGS